MRVGITYDLKVAGSPDGGNPADGPDDLQEEFDSPATIEAIALVLRGLGHDVIKLGDGRELIEQLLADPPDFVFNFAEGQGVGRAREARVPAVLEMLGIPYSGSDPLTLAATLDKDCAKRLAQSAGLIVPGGLVVAAGDDLPTILDRYDCPFPAIAKPAWEGSSKGIHNHCIIDKREDAEAVLDGLRGDYRQPILLEEYIEGDEITVGVYDNNPPRVLGTMRVLPRQPTERFIYSIEIKREFQKLVRYESPPDLPSETVAAIEAAALTAYRGLGCRDVARVDFRVRDGVPYFLEVNPLPGLNPETSDLVILAKLRGWTYRRLIETIFEAALKRHSLAQSARRPVPVRIR